MRNIARLGIALAISSALAAGLAAQDPLAEAKQLYDSASYAEALSALSRVPAAGDVVEVEKYRALCFLALNQPKEAEQALEQLAMSRPLYSLDGSDASPKLVSLFQDVRKRTIPAAAKQMYQRARASYDNGNLVEASRQFNEVVALADSAPPEHAVIMGELRMLAAGFARLSESVASKPNPTPQAPVVPMPAGQMASPATGSPISVPPPASTQQKPPVTEPSAASSGAASQMSDEIFDANSLGVQPPTVVSRTMPTWTRPSWLRDRSYKGTLEVIIGEQGTIVAAAMSEATHPAYDEMLVAAAKRWRFRPATSAGRPVKYRMTLAIVVPPASQD